MAETMTPGDGLARHIRTKLMSRKCCNVSQNQLDDAWPFGREVRLKQIEEIQEFANANGWSANFYDPGLRVTFQRLAD